MEDARHVVVKLKGTDTIVADSTITVRILETSHPPTFYIPKKDVNMELLKIAAGSSMCEWKGQATYYGVESSAPRSCWSYDSPFSEMTLIKVCDGLFFFFFFIFSWNDTCVARCLCEDRRRMLTYFRVTS